MIVVIKAIGWIEAIESDQLKGRNRDGRKKH